VAEGMVCLAKLIQSSLFPLAAGTGVEFGRHDRRQDGPLEDPGVPA
jgi:hypothetical protein